MKSLFYFNDVSQLTDFETFEVQPVSDCHSRTMAEGEAPKFWCVIGTLREEKSEGIQGRQFPVADLQSESYAELFACLCLHFIGKA
uniref:hypothetical protein n=1 Tax=Marinobacterium profundum TaxID=1714300 RepID=UPI000832F507|nr:hypothetical protein [Marinobacterium profundum]